jgi:hypothetical protein
MIFGLIVFDGNTKPDEVSVNRRTDKRQREFILSPFGLEYRSLLSLLYLRI